MVVGQPGQLGCALRAREYGHRLPASAQQGGNPGIVGPEVAVGVVAPGGDHGIDGRRAVVLFDGRFGIDVEQLPDDVEHQCGVLGRGLDQAAVAACHDAQQVEEADQRDVAGHDDQHAAGLSDGERGVELQPSAERLLLQHLVAQGLHGAADVVGGEPSVLRARLGDNAAARVVASERVQALTQRGKEFDRVFHYGKDNTSHRIPNAKCALLLFFHSVIRIQNGSALPRV